MLSDPEYEHLLPFPMVRMATPARFNIDEKYCWRYMGREKFAELLKELRFIRRIALQESLWVYGTSGYGKSHLLAALVCYLAALGERVIYLPCHFTHVLEIPFDIFKQQCCLPGLTRQHRIRSLHWTRRRR